MSEFKTIKEDTCAEIVEKKSRFIANVFYVSNVQDAEEKINMIKKKYYDAKHHCFAYSIIDNNNIINKFSDDGEPSGTAGSPMLNVIFKNNITNVLVIVTRYFGGILLGTGGLARAYTEASVQGIKEAIFIVKEEGIEAEVKLSYSDFEKFKYYCQKQNITIVSNSYDENVKVNIELNEKQKEMLLSKDVEKSFEIIKFLIIKNKIITKNIEN